MQTIVPNLWFDHTAAEAVELYVSAFPEAELVNTERYPTENLPEFQADMAGEVMLVDFTIQGCRFTGINAGAEFRPNPALSFMITFDPASSENAEQELRHAWQSLSEGGKELMPLQEYDFAPLYGWIEDRYGVSWQLILADPSRPAGPPVMPSFLFGGPMYNRAAEAIAFYTNVFSGEVIVDQRRPAGTPNEGSVLFCDFTMRDQHFVAMDSSPDQEFTFTPGVSLLVNVADQAELDALWAQLSTVPEVEQCGWCQDQFGFSWQVIPANFEQLMSKPGAYQKMLGMKKIVIADFD